MLGLICGYFIWEKGHMQTQDAEMEITKAVQDLNGLKKPWNWKSGRIGNRRRFARKRHCIAVGLHFAYS